MLNLDEKARIESVQATLLLAKADQPPCLISQLPSYPAICTASCRRKFYKQRRHADSYPRVAIVLIVHLSRVHQGFCTALRHISKIPQGLGYLRRTCSATKPLFSLLRSAMVDSSGSTAHLFSLVASSISYAQEKLVEIGVRTSLQICSSSDRKIEGEALHPHRIFTFGYYHTLRAAWHARVSRPTSVWARSCHRCYRHYRHPSQPLQSAHSRHVSRIYHKVGTCAVTPGRPPWH